jgi:DNA (cytosine-5)-methyltransferase 1
MQVPAISFFTGGGFLDIGLHRAGFRTVWTNENNSAFADMYESAMAGLRAATKDDSLPVIVSSRESVEDLRAKDVMREAFPKGRPDLFGVVGGPPCPDFSNGGAHAGGYGINGRLTKLYVEMVQGLRPDFFIMENVSGLHDVKKHRQFLLSLIKVLREESHYAVDLRVLNALELGVPQNRERLFVVGFKKAMAVAGAGEAAIGNIEGWFPWPSVARYAGARHLSWPGTSPFGGTPICPEGIPVELMVFPALQGSGDPELLPNGKEFFNAYSAKFRTRAEGDVSAKSFKRLHRYRFSPTVWYGNQEVHLHPWKPRRLSVREALRIQTAPDEYVLPADQPLSAKFKLICNGVPCVMAEEIGRSAMRFLLRAKEGTGYGPRRR